MFNRSSTGSPNRALLALALGAFAPAFGQPAPPVISPELNPDHSVTFRLQAPGASNVRLDLEGAPSAQLKRNASGTWTVTTLPLEPDYYGYSFSVDGIRRVDANDPAVKPGLLSLSNLLHVPGPPSLSWEETPVPHGEVHRHFYHSAICGDDRDFWVYTPPGYSSEVGQRYPTLYLLHGFSDSAAGWTTVGRANFILDNLIAEKKAKPMVVVMPLGYGTMEIVAKAKAANGNMRAGGLPLMVKSAARFQQALLEEVIPQVERDYRVRSRRNDRAIAGLSMGGGESLQTGLAHADYFGWVGSFSAGGITEDFESMLPGLDPKKAAKLKLLWIACGKEDTLYTLNQNLRAFLTAKGIPHVDITTPRAHVWMVWRRNLTEFAPLLFR